MNAAQSVCVTIDGQTITVPADASVAAAVACVTLAFRRSVQGQPRAPVCGMGVCFECRVSVDGAAHVRACMTPVRDGMRIDTDV